MRKTALLLLFSLYIAGCGGGAPSRGAATPSNVEAVPTSGSAAPADANSASTLSKASIAAAPAMAPGAAPPPATPSVAGARTGAAAVKPARPEMLDIEANLTIEVESVAEAAAALRALSRRFEGVVTEDRLNQTAKSANAQLTIRVPSAQVDGFFDAVGTVGILRSRQINARDIGKEFFDAEIRLENLQATMRRYEEILKQGKSVEELMRIENELGRLRGEIEQTKGNLRWLSDRAARATVHINLTSTSREIVAPTLTLAPPPEAKLHPGLRLVQLTDLRGEQGNTGYLGGGVSVSFSRHFSVQLDALRESGQGAPTKGVNVMLFTIGGEMYSDFLGGGRRKYLNPYLGYVLGYSRFLGRNEGVLGATLGLELVKMKVITLDLQARALGLLFSSEGAHVGVEPVLQLSVPF